MLGEQGRDGAAGGPAADDDDVGGSVMRGLVMESLLNCRWIEYPIG